MADELPEHASEHEILEHLGFLDVCIESLEHDDPAHDEELAKLLLQKDIATRRLNLLQSNTTSASPAPDMASVSSSPRNLGLKRNATAGLDEYERHSKRPPPDRSNAPTPSSSSPFEVIEHSTADVRERVRRGQLAIEAALRRQREDEAFARSLWQEPSPPPSAPAQSSRVQTTFGSTGNLQRPPVRAKPEPSPAPGSSRNPFSAPFPVRSPTRPSLKTEPTSFARSGQPSRYRDLEVVDLTDDNDDVPHVQPSARHAPGSFVKGSWEQGLPPVSSTLSQSRSNYAPTNMYAAHQAQPQQQHSSLSRPPVPSRPWMPGTYPDMPPNYGNHPGTHDMPTYGSQSFAGRSALQPRITSGYSVSSHRWPQLIDDEDDGLELLGTGSRPAAPGMDMYAGLEDLYQRRYEDIVNYDPAKTQEEINALLSNIRPDEEMPAHLRVQTPVAMAVKLHKYQELGLTWLKQCEEGPNKGGILADDMGLGKTIQMLSLMVENKSEDYSRRTNLIIAPVALLRQWKQEIEQKVKPGKDRLSVHIHHASSKKTHFADLQNFDVVITTYGSLGSELKKHESWKLRLRHDPNARMGPKDRCVLIGDECKWYRIILDEAQYIKNHNTQTHKAAMHLKAKYKFCVTGTPMMNNVDELWSLVHWLGIKPFCVRERFRVTFSQPLKGNGSEATREAAMNKLQALCKAVMLRRTKTSTFEGKPILVLPAKTVNIDHPVFDEAERDFYTALETDARVKFNKYYKANTVGRHYSHILVLLLRLRQACCHPHLIKDFGVSAAAGISPDTMTELAKTLAPQVVARIRAKEGSFECPICWDAAVNPAIFIPCGHESCSECFAKLTDPANAIEAGDERGSTKARCPNCRGDVDTKKVIDFETFRQVHQTDLNAADPYGDPAHAAAEAEKAPEDSETESESGSQASADDDDDDDDQNEDDDSDGEDDSSSMKDFIVDDDQGVYDGAESWSGDEENHEQKMSKGKGKMPVSREEKLTENSSSKKPKKAKKSKKSKGKGKAKKEDTPRKPKHKDLTLAELKKRSMKDRSCRDEYFRRLRENWTSSAKIEKTLQVLRGIMEQPEGEREKVLVFSQWTSLLDLIEVPIDKEHWGYRRYDGSMSATARSDAVDDFRDARKNVRIMLLSLKAGNAGLNLNMASQVIILDPFWNPYIEEQAIDRAHRLGQTRPVIVHRLLIETTVEDRIMELQEKKRALISQALDEKAGQSLARLGVNELRYLFGATRSLN